MHPASMARPHHGTRVRCGGGGGPEESAGRGSGATPSVYRSVSEGALPLRVRRAFHRCSLNPQRSIFIVIVIVIVIFIVIIVVVIVIVVVCDFIAIVITVIAFVAAERAAFGDVELDGAIALADIDLVEDLIVIGGAFDFGDDAVTRMLADRHLHRVRALFEGDNAIVTFVVIIVIIIFHHVADRTGISIGVGRRGGRGAGFDLDAAGRTEETQRTQQGERDSCHDSPFQSKEAGKRRPFGQPSWYHALPRYMTE